jgi:hypothetical protein
VIVFSYHIIIEEATGDTFGSQQTVMKIIETNQFKQLCHLCLILSIGNDVEVKKHLAVQLKSLKVQFFKNTTNLYSLHIHHSLCIYFTAVSTFGHHFELVILAFDFIV